MKRHHHYLLWIGVALVAWYFRAALLKDVAKVFAAAGVAPSSPRASNPAATSVTVDNPASTLAEAFFSSNPSTPGPHQYPIDNTSLLAPGQVIDRFGRDVTPDYFGSRVGDPLGDPQLRTHDIFGNPISPFDASLKLIGGGYGGGGGGGLSAQSFFRGGSSSGGAGPFRIL